MLFSDIPGGSPELKAALDRLLDSLGSNAKPADMCEDIATFYDNIPELKGTDFGKRIREAKYDTDRMEAIIDEASEYAKRVRDAVP